MEVGVKLLVKGRVQGVGFRWCINQRATALGVVGYVRNLPDGNVEIVAEGERGRLEELIKYIKAGPTFSKVNDLIIDWCEYRGKYSEFKIVI